jgi:predicted amidohydrolase YtcJ
MTAEMILTNARILTMDATRPRARAIALGGGRILALDDAALALRGPGTRVIDAEGRTVLPGFIESHMHLFVGSAGVAHCQLWGLRGQEALAAALRAYAEGHPGAPLLIAKGADYGMLGHPMTRADLDAALPDRPVIVVAPDHHTAWANTAALTAAGLLHGRTLPPGNEVAMGADGLATGELRESLAFEPVMALAGEDRSTLGLRTGGDPATPPTAAERAADRATLARGLAHCARHGITTAVNMDGNPYTASLLAEMSDAGDLTVRQRIPFHFKPFMEPDALDTAERMRATWADDWVATSHVKLFIDGVIDSGTAWLTEDYADRPGWRGEPLFEPARFRAILTEIDRRGFQIAVHAIGDMAVRLTLDGYAQARAMNGARDSRHRIEHVELLHRDDLPRFAELGVVASMQPSHPPGAMDFPAIGEGPLKIRRERFGDSFPWADLLASGAALAFASDWPVADINPLRSIQAALTRKPMGDEPPQRLTLMQVLHAYTAGGAHAEGTDDRKGRLVPGMLADLVVLSSDIEATAPDAIGAMTVALTICGGRVTHQGADLPLA